MPVITSVHDLQQHIASGSAFQLNERRELESIGTAHSMFRSFLDIFRSSKSIAARNDGIMLAMYDLMQQGLRGGIGHGPANLANAQVVRPASGMSAMQEAKIALADMLVMNKGTLTALRKMGLTREQAVTAQAGLQQNIYAGVYDRLLGKAHGVEGVHNVLDSLLLNAASLEGKFMLGLGGTHNFMHACTSSPLPLLSLTEKRAFFAAAYKEFHENMASQGGKPWQNDVQTAEAPQTEAEMLSYLHNKHINVDNYTVETARAIFEKNSALAHAPCPLAEKFALGKLLHGKDLSLMVAINAYDAMRALQPEGALKAETVWRGCFNEPLPHPAPQNFSTAFATRGLDLLRQLTADTAAAVSPYVLAHFCEEMPLAQAVALIHSEQFSTAPGTITENIFPDPLHALSVGGDESLVTDICRRGPLLVTNADGTVRESPSTITVGTQTFSIGREDVQEEGAEAAVRGGKTGFLFNSWRDFENYRTGSPNSLEKALRESVYTLCGGANSPQSRTVLSLMDQRIMNKLVGRSGFFKGLLAITEHAGARISVTPQPNHSVTVHLETGADPAQTAQHGGYITVDIVVNSDGSYQSAAMNVVKTGRNAA